MISQLNEDLKNYLIDRSQRKKIFLAKEREEFLKTSKNIRSVDYLANLHIGKNGVSELCTLTTRANWFFFLTNCAVYIPFAEDKDKIKIMLWFPDFSPNSPFSSSSLGAVDNKLVLTQEGGARFEEYKNLFYPLGQRFNINMQALGSSSNKQVFCLLSGLEISNNEV